MNKLQFLFAAFLMAACSTRTVKNAASLQGRLFPNGIYRHQVHVRTIDAPAGVPQEMDLHGVVSTSDSEIKVVGLSPIGFTLFRLTENRATGQVQKEFFVDAVKKGEPFVMKFYGVLKEMLLTTDRSPHQVSGNTTFDFENPDDHQIPQKIRIDNPRFKIEVDVTGYEI